jgi:hypothetical protein
MIPGIDSAVSRYFLANCEIRLALVDATGRKRSNYALSPIGYEPPFSNKGSVGFLGSD